MGGSNNSCDDWRDFDLTVDIVCNMDAKEIRNISVDEMNHCFKVVRFEHASGCKIQQLSALWEWAQKHGSAIAVPFIAIGFVMLFLGFRWMTTVYYATAIILTVSVVWLIFYTTFMENNHEDGLGWVIVIFSMLLGLCLGYTFSKY